MKPYTRQAAIKALESNIAHNLRDIAKLEREVPEFWNLKQYTALWHYTDGLKLALFMLTGEPYPGAPSCGTESERANERESSTGERR